jgi:hypothetical protein
MCPLAPSTFIQEESIPVRNQFHGGINPPEESMPRKKRPVAINVLKYHLCPRDYETRKAKKTSFFGCAKREEH